MVRKLDQVLIVEAMPNEKPLLGQCPFLAQNFGSNPIQAVQLNELKSNCSAAAQLILLHTDLTVLQHLQLYINLQSTFPDSHIIIVGSQINDELCLQAVEAGAEECVQEEAFTPLFMQKLVLKSLRRSDTEIELRQSKQQLLACIENTPNVAVQWYNAAAEVVFWNKASELLFGWTAEEALGKKINRLIHTPEDEALWVDKIKNVKATGLASEPQEWAFTRQNGTKGWCISTLFCIPSYTGETLFVCMDVDITEQKQTEIALRESEDRYYTLFAEASDAIFINDDRGWFIEINQRACDLLGYTKEQLRQMAITDLYDEEELTRKPIMWKELLSGQRTSVERHITHANGTKIAVEITAQMFKANRFMAILRNISERKVVEEALKQSEEKYRLLVEQQADGIATFDSTGKILNVNGSASKLLQFSSEELLTMRLQDILSEEDQKNNPVDYAALEQGEATIKQRKMYRKDGTLVETEVHTKRLYNGHFLSTVRDLTERLEVQRQLEKEKVLSDSIINSLPGLFYLYQPGYGYLRWNKKLEKIAGYTAGEIKKMQPLDFIPADDKESVRLAIQEIFEKGEAAIEANLLTKEGIIIPYYFTGCFINYAGSPSFLGTGIDISEIKYLEKALSRQKITEQKKIIQAMINAEEKEKNKLGLELHDNISQILSVVRMYIMLLNSGNVPSGVTLTQTEKLLNSAIEEIRNLSHRLAVSYNFDAGLTEALNDMINKISIVKDFSINLSTSEDLNEITTHEQKLAIYRIVQEQLNNVTKYAKATQVEVNIDNTDEEIILVITDNGKGFDPSQVEKGLGLNNIINRAESLCGKARVQSAPGKGCRVTVKIPMLSDNDE